MSLVFQRLQRCDKGVGDRGVGVLLQQVERRDVVQITWNRSTVILPIFRRGQFVVVSYGLARNNACRVRHSRTVDPVSSTIAQALFSAHCT